MGWPPQAGELLPLGDEAFGIREKLAGYSLDLANQEGGGPKAKGFAVILGITLDSIDYLEAEIRRGIQQHPIKAVRVNEPYGWNCVVEFPLQGVGSYSERAENLRTVWELAEPLGPPRLVNAFLKRN